MTVTDNRPTTAAGMVGQTELLARMRVVYEGAKLRGLTPPHTLLSGPAGHGKTTLAQIIAHDLGAPLVKINGPMLKTGAELCSELTKILPNTVLFIDEIHRLPMAVEETLYEALEDGAVSMMIGGASNARAMTIKLPPFIVIGATTMPGALPTPLRDRFGFHAAVKPYSMDEIAQIVANKWAREALIQDGAAAIVVAGRSKLVPRRAIHLADRVADWCAVHHYIVDGISAGQALDSFGISANGLDEIDLRIIGVLVRSGKPVGLSNLAQALDVDVKTIEQEHEGALVRMGYIMRSSSGRIATPAAHELIRSQA